MLRVTAQMYADSTGVVIHSAYRHLRQIDPDAVTVVRGTHWFPLHLCLAQLAPRYRFAGPALLAASVSDESPYYGPEDLEADKALENYINSVPGGEARLADTRLKFLRALAASLRSSALWVNTEAIRLQLLRLDFVIEHAMTGNESVLPKTPDEWRFEALRFSLLHHSQELDIEEKEEAEAFA